LQLHSHRTDRICPPRGDGAPDTIRPCGLHLEEPVLGDIDLQGEIPSINSESGASGRD
jgi:hypothetical protein